MKSEKYLSALKHMNSVRKGRATRGERILSALFPNRGVGYPSGWQSDRLEQVQHLRHWTYVAIHTIASKIASITPNIAYVTDAPKVGHTTKVCNRTPYQFGGESFISEGGHSFLTMGAYRSKSLSVVKPHEELEPLESYHPLRRLFENPNAVDTFFDLGYELQMFDELCGVNYLWSVPNAAGVPCELWVIPSHWVWPRTGGSGAGSYVNPERPDAGKLIQYYEIRPWGGMGSAGVLRLPPEEVIMSAWKSPLNKIDGYSKLYAAAQWIDSEESISRSRWSQFQNQARPEFWVELGPGYEDPDDDRISRLEAKFAAKIQGEYNYGKPVITPPGAKITPLSFNPTEMAYYQCLSDDTECLTDQGWKRYTELTVESRVLCFDDASYSFSYYNPSRVFREHYEGLMCRWRGPKVDALMTPNHRTYLREEPCSSTVRPLKFEVRMAGEIPLMSWYKVMTYDDFREEAYRLDYEVLTPPQRSVIHYKGDVWCVTVPTGLFVVRRNGKAHVTGNSEEQIRDMILAAFQVPKTAVGISNDMTYGSLLASLSQLCAYCLNPRLAQRGQSLTKHLGSRWDQRSPSYSTLTGKGHGGGSIVRKVRIWYDDCVPADPTQVNADIAEDRANYAITPNEVRALRGRKAYRAGGDDPIAPGPGGVMPFPLNTGEDLGDLAELIKPMTQQGQEGDQGGMPGMTGGGKPGGSGEPGEEGPESELPDDEGGEEGLEELDTGGIEEPNSKPSKGYTTKSLRENKVEEFRGQLGEFSEEELDGIGVWYNPGPPSLILIDVMDWGDGEVGRRIGKLASKAVGDEARVVWQNEGATPSKDAGWEYLVSANHGVVKSPDTPPQEILPVSPPSEEKHWLEVKTPGLHEYSSTQFNLEDAGFLGESNPLDGLIQLRDSIAEEDLGGDGREEELHVTVKYGLHTDDPEEVRELAEGFGVVRAVLGKVSIFPASESGVQRGGESYDVVKVEVESPDLHGLNELLSALPHTDTHPKYQPHITLAYVKAGEGEKYVGGDEVDGMEVYLGELVFSDKVGNREVIELGGERELGVVVRKGSGEPCEPGETASQTGCRPLRDGGSKGGYKQGEGVKGSFSGLPKTAKEAGLTMANALASLKPEVAADDSLRQKVAANWARELRGRVISSGADYDVLKASLDSGLGNQDYEDVKRVRGEQAVVLVKPEKEGSPRRGESIGASVLIYSHPSEPLEYNQEPPYPGMTTGEDSGGIAGVLRHEYAHRVYGQLSRKEQDLWEENARGLYPESKGVKEELTVYAGRSFSKEEWFTEAFSIGTALNYDPSKFSDRARQLISSTILAAKGDTSKQDISKKLQTPGRLRKAVGTCKPGQTAASTGCTPATGSGGKTSSSTSPPENARQHLSYSYFNEGVKKLESIKDTVTRFGKAGYEELGPPAKRALVRTWAMAKWVEHKVSVGFRKSKQVAERVAQERGMSADGAARLAKMLGIADMITAWTINMPATLAVTGSMTLAKASSWVPVASLAYIGYSTARNPLAVLRAARATLLKAAEHKGLLGSDFVNDLADALEQSEDQDWLMALWCVAMDEECDASKALAKAKRLAIIGNRKVPMNDSLTEDDVSLYNFPPGDQKRHPASSPSEKGPPNPSLSEPVNMLRR